MTTVMKQKHIECFSTRIVILLSLIFPWKSLWMKCKKRSQKYTKLIYLSSLFLLKHLFFLVESSVLKSVFRLGNPVISHQGIHPLSLLSNHHDSQLDNLRSNLPVNHPLILHQNHRDNQQLNRLFSLPVSQAINQPISQLVNLQVGRRVNQQNCQQGNQQDNRHINRQGCLRVNHLESRR